MSLQASPRSITITETNPATVDHYLIQVFDLDDHAIAGNTYPISGNVTVCPVGTDGFLGNLLEAGTMTDGQQFNFKVTEKKNGLFGPVQLAPGGPYTLVLLPDGAETIVVTL